MNGIVDGIRQNGPAAARLQKVKEYMVKQHTDNKRKNEYALKNAWQYYVYQVDLEKDYLQQVESLSEASLRQFADRLFGQGNRVEVSMSSDE